MKEPWFFSRSFIKDKAEYLKGDVIDIGCGSSKYKSIILGFRGVKSFTGIDFIKDTGVDIVADLNSPFPIKDNSYDSAICISVLEHLLEPKEALKEMNRILKPEGSILLATPWIFPYHAVPDDYFRFSRKALEYLAAESGFRVVYAASSGGKLRIISTFFTYWFPWTKRFHSGVSWLLGAIDSQKGNEDTPFPNTPSHHMVLTKNKV
jgi:SAM-dependent methyltransferase